MPGATMTRVDPVLKEFLENREAADILEAEKERRGSDPGNNDENNGEKLSLAMGGRRSGRYATRSASASPLKDINGNRGNYR